MRGRQRVAVAERIPEGCVSVQEYRYSPRTRVAVGDTIVLKALLKGHKGSRATVRRIFASATAVGALPDRGDVREVEVITEAQGHFRTVTPARIERP